MGRVSKEFRPRARSTGLVVRELDREILVFDRQQDKAFCLNEIAGQVWQLSDGRTSVAYMVHLIRDSNGAAVNENTVNAAIKQLDKDGLLDNAADRVDDVMSRRDLMRRTGVAAAVALPMITAISLPTTGFAWSSPPPVCSPSQLGCGGNKEHCGCCVVWNGKTQCGVCSSCSGSQQDDGSGHCCQINSMSTGVKCCPGPKGQGWTPCAAMC